MYKWQWQTCQGSCFVRPHSYEHLWKLQGYRQAELYPWLYKAQNMASLERRIFFMMKNVRT